MVLAMYKYMREHGTSLQKVADRVFQYHGNTTYVYPTLDVIATIADIVWHSGSDTVLEIFAGNGHFAETFQKSAKHCKYIATDSCDPTYMKNHTGRKIKHLTACEALHKYKNHKPFVLCMLPHDPVHTLPKVFKKIKTYKLCMILCVYNTHLRLVKAECKSKKIKIRKIDIPVLVYEDTLYDNRVVNSSVLLYLQG
jgi:hypothetical protein